MQRTYKSKQQDDLNITSSTANFFTGVEVERTPAFGMQTLFVVGLPTYEEVTKQLILSQAKHIYFGANHSFNSIDYHIHTWNNYLEYYLNAGYWCTLDFDAQYLKQVNVGLSASTMKHFNFIPQISVKLPYISNLNYNATIKIDDTDFQATNPGVWCHSVSSLLNRTVFTHWDEYKDDKLLTEDK